MTTFTTPLTTRWADNDVYGHVNNVTYYAYFDSIVNLYLIREGSLDIHGPVIGLIVASSCQFHAPLTYPDELVGAMRVTKLGTSSVTYEVTIAKAGAEQLAATASLTHVFVDRTSRRPTPIPEPIRAALAKLVVA
ncbi:MAG TPA: thioesterase family protein [Kofleriaceae bacterium]|nr:thioesterase family protein [Kofleriaceae bacterium]